MCTKARVHIRVAAVYTCDRMGVRCGSGGGGDSVVTRNHGRNHTSEPNEPQDLRWIKGPVFSISFFLFFSFSSCSFVHTVTLEQQREGFRAQTEAWDVTRESER